MLRIPIRKVTSPLGIQGAEGRGFPQIRAALSAQAAPVGPVLRIPGGRYDRDSYDECIYDGVAYLLYGLGHYNVEVYS